MGAPSRFAPSGVTNAAVGTALGMMGQPDPTKYHTFFDDFDRYVAGDWTITTTELGAGSASEALTDADGGVLLITNDAADNDNDFFQKVGESFLLEAGKKAWFKARFKVSDATQSDIVMGLQITDATPLAVSDGVWFQKDDGDANIDFHVASGSVQTDQAAVGTLVDNTYVTLAWYYDGADEIHVFVDDVKVATVSTANLPATELTVSFGIQNGEAVAKTMSMDYVLVAKER